MFTRLSMACLGEDRDDIQLENKKKLLGSCQGVFWIIFNEKCKNLREPRRYLNQSQGE